MKIYQKKGYEKNCQIFFCCINKLVSKRGYMKSWLIKGEQSSVFIIFLIEHTYNFYESTIEFNFAKLSCQNEHIEPKKYRTDKIKTVLEFPQCLVSILKTLRALNKSLIFIVLNTPGPLCAGAAWEKMRSRSRLKKSQEPEPLKNQLAPQHCLYVYNNMFIIFLSLGI